MAIRKIILIEDEVLRKKSREVTVFDKKLWDLLDDMKETMEKAEGVGLAAVQVGILKRIAVVQTESSNFTEIINPEIVLREGNYEDSEGCLSIPKTKGVVIRPQKINLVYFDRFGNRCKLIATELFARAICHEIDHMNGVLFIDKIKD